jgi:hypothetical protein
MRDPFIGCPHRHHKPITGGLAFAMAAQATGYARRLKHQRFV